jgi:GNAT superfamily N-acetyltransferase
MSGQSLELRIRAALPDDTENVVRIYVTASNAGFGSLMDKLEVTPKRLANWRADLSRPAPHRWWVAEVNGTIAGFAGIGPSRDPIDPAIGELDTIAIDPAYWRKGVGKQLMATVLRQLALDGYREAVVWTLADYEQGMHFYESTGWCLNGKARRDGREICYGRRLVSPDAGAQV